MKNHIPKAFREVELTKEKDKISAIIHYREHLVMLTDSSKWDGILYLGIIEPKSQQTYTFTPLHSKNSQELDYIHLSKLLVPVKSQDQCQKAGLQNRL